MKPYYEQDGVTIYHGDCLSVLSEIDADFMITDPPYGINLTNHGMVGSNGWSLIAGDTDTAAVLEAFRYATTRGMPVIAFASPFKPWPLMARNLIVWNKGGAVGGGGDTSLCLKRSWELIQVEGNRVMNNGRLESVWSYPIGQGDLHFHPTQKPEYLMGKLMNTFANQADVALDPFVGSGSTLVAARMQGRRAIGIEIEEHYCEIAARRLSQRVLPLESAWNG